MNRSVEAIPEVSMSPMKRIQMTLEHAELLKDIRGERVFHSIKRHLRGYLSHFRGAAILRRQAMLTQNYGELSAQLEPFL
jgi:tRNA-dihydrouridine synthase